MLQFPCSLKPLGGAQELGRPDKLQTFAKDRPVRVIRHISWTPQFHTWAPTEILLWSQETRGSFIRNVLFKSIFSRQISRRLGNLERDWPTGWPVTHMQSFFSSVATGHVRRTWVEFHCFMGRCNLVPRVSHLTAWGERSPQAVRWETLGTRFSLVIFWAH